jgi:hypothetical protein
LGIAKISRESLEKEITPLGKSGSHREIKPVCKIPSVSLKMSGHVRNLSGTVGKKHEKIFPCQPFPFYPRFIAGTDDKTGNISGVASVPKI